jgi:hypothetical protein
MIIYHHDDYVDVRRLDACGDEEVEGLEEAHGHAVAHKVVHLGQVLRHAVVARVERQDLHAAEKKEGG